MLTPEQITALRDAVGRVTDPISDFLVDDIARRIAGAGQLTATASYQIWRAQQLGLSQKALKKRLRTLLKVSHRDLRRLLTQSAEVGYDFDIKHLPYVQAVPFAQNAVLQQTVSAAVALAQEDFTNLTQTLGMVGPDGVAYPLQEAYRKSMDYAFGQVFTGATDYNTAIRMATKNLADMGVRVIDYASGVHTSLEAATRRNIMGGLGLMQEQISQQNHDALGADGWEISAHAASAPDHEPYQGHQYSDSQYEALNGSLKRRINTLNCGHAAFPIILGVSSQQHTPEELEEFIRSNAEGVDYQGKHYTLYEATQKQRQVESAIRTQKHRVLTANATGDTALLETSQIRLRRLNDEYARFSRGVGLRTQRERAQVAGFGRGQNESKIKARVVNARKDATIERKEANGGRTTVQTIGKLNIEKYKCVTADITTDEVVITDERIAHIKERHPNDFERYRAYISQMIANPDYILEANRPDTAFLLKRFEENGEHFELIVRLKTSKDAENYKNSVITFLKVDEKRYKRYLRTKNVLYSAE